MFQPGSRSVYHGTFIHCKTLGELEILEDKTIGVDENGKITFVSAAGDLADVLMKHSWNPDQIKYFPPKTSNTTEHIQFFFPGFLDTHIHASQHPNAGIFGKTTLLSWLETYTFPLESSLSDPKKAEAVYKTCVKSTLSHGTTTAAYYATISTESTDILAKTCRDLGQRAFVGRCAMDNQEFQPEYYRDRDAETAIRESRRSAESILAADKTGLVKPIITPRFALSCTEISLKGLAEVAKDLDIPVQTHISENLDEVALVAKVFPDHSSYTAVYDNCGLLGPKTILAHACHLSKDEVEIVRKTRASISHCPVSNTSLGSGLCPVREYLNQGVTIGLGSDVSGGYSPSILVAAREAGAVSRLRTAPGVKSGFDADGHQNKDDLKLTVEETLYLATQGGAKCLALEDKVGSFEVGKEWDALYIDLGPNLETDAVLSGHSVPSNVQVWEWMGWEERIAKWIHQGDERNISAVWVRGRQVVGSSSVIGYTRSKTRELQSRTYSVFRA